MQEAQILEIAQAFSQMGRVALWLGSEWRSPSNPDDLQLIALKEWAGVWSESCDPGLSETMGQLWPSEQRSRQLVNVPNALGDALGSGFRYSDFIPFMFLKGVGDGLDPLDPISRSDARVDKIRELGRLEGGILLVAATRDCEEAFQTAAEAGRRAGDLRRIILLGLTPGTCEVGANEFYKSYPTEVDRVQTYPCDLVGLLRQLEKLTITTGEPKVRIGSTEVPLQLLMRQEPPITQDFSILTTHDITPVSQGEESATKLLTNTLAGAICPWRSIARGYVWDGRPELAAWRREISDAIQTIRKDERMVVAIDVEAEPGSGITILLSQLAVYAASQDCPTLFHLAPDTSFSYARLRTFLTDMYRGISSADARTPAVIIFDTDSSWSDYYGYLDQLPHRLNRDGRRAVIVRARQVTGPSVTTGHVEKGTPGISYVSISEPLKERLPESGAHSLANWLSEKYREIDDSSLPSDWYQRFLDLSNASGCPFLITFSLLLVERYRSVARLGERLVSRLERVVDAVEAERNPSAKPVPDEPDDCVQRSLRAGLALGVSSKTSREDFYSLAIVLSAMGCLRTPVPRGVLGYLAEVDPTDIIAATTLLECAGLTLSREATPFLGYGASLGGPYRTRPATVQLVHHEYGRLLLEYLIENKDGVAGRLPPNRGIVSELLAVASKLMVKGRLSALAVDLVGPVLRRMRPGDANDRAFAEQMVQRYLRVQREKGLIGENQFASHDEERTFRRWQWRNRTQVLSDFEWLPSTLVKSSASILHSRAITRAKCTLNEHPEQARPLYRGAEEDLIAALEIQEDKPSDNPAHILSTLGMVYVHWAHMERLHSDPDGRVPELDRLADSTLRKARALQLDSAYPAYHLATHKVDAAEFLLKEGTPDAQERAACSLAEALELLAGEPERNFRAEWDELLSRAIGLLGDKGDAAIIQLKSEHNLLGWALDALRELDGEFPREHNVEIGEPELSRAWAILEEGFAEAKGESAPIAELLRYSVFSFRKERETHPAYDRRLAYIEPIVETKYYEDDPTLQFDYGMLCYQNRRLVEGAKTFRDLRRGQRFFFVPRERAVVLSEAPSVTTPKRFRLQVQSVDITTGQGWGRIMDPERFPDPVPFAVRAFQSRDFVVAVRTLLPCHVTIRPAGPYAEPIITR